jgi:hypothetical protein
MKRVSFVFFVGTKDCGHSYVLGVQTPPVLYLGVFILGITDAVMGIAFGFSFLALPMRSWVLLMGFR